MQILPPSTGLPSFFCLLLPSSVDHLSRLNLCSSHQAAVHPGNHKPSLAGLKWSVGDWRQAGNDAVLRKGWCKYKQKKQPSSCHLCSLLGHLVYQICSPFLFLPFLHANILFIYLSIYLYNSHTQCPSLSSDQRISSLVHQLEASDANNSLTDLPAGARHRLLAAQCCFFLSVDTCRARFKTETANLLPPTQALSVDAHLYLALPILSIICLLLL